MRIFVITLLGSVLGIVVGTMVATTLHDKLSAYGTILLGMGLGACLGFLLSGGRIR
jgi:hypothetical protein